MLLFPAAANADGLFDFVQGFFHPPEVEMKERYEPKPDGPVFDHSVFDQLLKSHVNSRGGVDYEAIRSKTPQLDAYIKSLSEAPYEELGRNEKLALLMNAYNAFTIRLILDFWPLGSIKDIPSSKRWDHKRWQVGPHTWSLSEIEHEQIRPNFIEPRIHFAVNCAAVGCPPLRMEAYSGSTLDSQLEDQAAYVHAHNRWLVLKNGEVQLTKLYDWYEGDFEQTAGSILKYAAAYSPELKLRIEQGSPPKIEWLAYSWKLNTQKNLPDEDL